MRKQDRVVKSVKNEDLTPLLPLLLLKRNKFNGSGFVGVRSSGFFPVIHSLTCGEINKILDSIGILTY
jgi:hypothetical protein